MEKKDVKNIYFNFIIYIIKDLDNLTKAELKQLIKDTVGKKKKKKKGKNKKKKIISKKPKKIYSVDSGLEQNPNFLRTVNTKADNASI